MHFGYGTTGAYGPAAYSSPSRALLSADSSSSLGSSHLFGAHQSFSTVPPVSKLVAPTCNLVSQQAEPACVQQGICARCFERTASDLGLQVDIRQVRLQETSEHLFLVMFMLHWKLLGAPALCCHHMYCVASALLHVTAVSGACSFDGETEVHDWIHTISVVQVKARLQLTSIAPCLLCLR